MVERGAGETLGVDHSLIERAFRSSVSFLRDFGELRSGDDKKLRLVGTREGVEISTVSLSSTKELQILSQMGLDGKRRKDLILERACRICVTRRQTQPEVAEREDSLVLHKFDPERLNFVPEDKWKMREILEGGVQYSIEGEGTPESLTERINQLILVLG